LKVELLEKIRASPSRNISKFFNLIFMNFLVKLQRPQGAPGRRLAVRTSLHFSENARYFTVIAARRHAQKRP
jgi:hypothetical protein